MKTPDSHPFRSKKARDRYLKLYDERARNWPVESETRFVATPFGETFLRVSGPTAGPPLVLLPSTSATSLFWRPNIEGLSKSFRVYALDNIYDFGRSIFRRPFKTVDDYTGWLDSLFDALQLEDQVNLMGISYGGWLTAQYALRFPERLRKAVIISPPATIIQLPGAWAWYGLTALIPHRYFLRNMMRWMLPELSRRTDAASVQSAQELLEDAFVAMRCFKLKMPVNPTVLTDDEFHRLAKVPTLFLVGDQEVLYPADQAIERLNKISPAIETHIVQGAGHDLTMVQADQVNSLVTNFLGPL